MKKGEDFSEWYNEVIEKANLSDKRYPIKGMNVWTPYGWAVMRRIDDFIRQEMAATDHGEVCFPLLIPESEFRKESMHIKGFESDVFWVTHAGTNPLDVRLLLRPTSETAMYPMFSLWIRSHADLPLKTYQIVNVFRYETKVTRAFMRVREIHFFESHTCHATFEEAERQIEEDLVIMDRLARRLAMPYLLSRRPEWDKFAGAYYSIGVDVYVAAAGRALQVGGIHQYRDNFARAYDVKFESDISQADFAAFTAKLLEHAGYEDVRAETAAQDKTLARPDVTAAKGGKRYAVVIRRRIRDVDEGKQVEAAVGRMKDAGLILVCEEMPAETAERLKGKGVEVWDSMKLAENAKAAGMEPLQLHQFVHQTTYGMSERLVGTIVAIHGDDRGVLFPPEVAPIQVVIVPIPEKGKQETIAAEAVKLNEEIKGDFRTHLDDRDLRPGNKFYEWEAKGVPLRLELGPKDLQKGVVTAVRRDTMEKTAIPRGDLLETVKKLLGTIQDSLLAREEKRLRESIVDVKDLGGFKDGLNRAGWCGAEECGHEIENRTGMSVLGTPRKPEDFSGACVVCGKPTKQVIYVAKTF